MIKQKRKTFDLKRSVAQLNHEMSNLPNEETVIKFVSEGKFSSLSFITFVARKTKINNLYISSLRIGKKELAILHKLKQAGRINNIFFVINSIMKKDSHQGLKYKYFESFEEICANNDWEYKIMNNHSKLFLFDTDCGYYVLETSSNLNENPKIEQFSFEQSEELYNYYKQMFEEWFDG